MRRFTLRCNIERFERVLARETEPAWQKVIAELLGKACREPEMLTSRHAELPDALLRDSPNAADRMGLSWKV